MVFVLSVEITGLPALRKVGSVGVVIRDVQSFVASARYRWCRVCGGSGGGPTRNRESESEKKKMMKSVKVRGDENMKVL